VNISSGESRAQAVGGSTNARIDDQRIFRLAGAMLLLAALGYLVWRIVEPVWHPLAWALLLGILLAPANRWVTARVGGSRQVGSAITLLVTGLFLILPLAIIAGEMAAQATHLHGRLVVHPSPGGAAPLRLLPTPEWLDGSLAGIAASVNVSLDQIHHWLTAGLKQLSERLAGSAGAFLSGVFGTAVNFVLMLFVLFFALRDGPDVANAVVRMLPIERRRRKRLRQHLLDVTRGVFRGIGVAALVHGALIGIGAWLAGLPSPLVIGLIAALLALVPVVGSALVWVPATLYLLSRGDTGQAIFLAAWSVVLVGVVDHVLRPWLISGSARVPTLPVFLGVVGGLHAFGFIGLFLGPIVLGMLVALFRYESEIRSAEWAS
jgi:predicted PurR-regulated permease PerM